MSESRRNLAKELYEHRNDPGEWGEEAEEIEVKPRRSSVLSFRLPSEEMDALERDMERTGESLSEYIRNALALRLRGGDFAGSMIGTMYGSVGIPTEEPDRRVVNSNFLMGNFTRAYFRRNEKPEIKISP